MNIFGTTHLPTFRKYYLFERLWSNPNPLTLIFSHQTILELYNSFGNTDFTDLLSTPPLIKSNSTVHLLKAENNTVWEEPNIAKTLKLIRDGNTTNFEEHVLLGAGHWVHVDKLKELVGIMTPSIIKGAE